MRLHVRTDALMREVCQILGVTVEHDEPAAAAAAQAAAAAEDAAHAAAVAAAAAAPAVPKKQPKPVSTVKATGRPSRWNTERLRGLYNPVSWHAFVVSAALTSVHC
jgi:pyruvate/2-oxoglutarate dehydrogenase complex dihydrolipoamide acyltransferase (E2) component